ncbi:MAG: flagellar motor switch protein FliG [Gammaproteobacteria bacterium]
MVESNASKLSGTDRSAVLLLALGEGNAAEVLKHMGPKEVQKIGSAMAAMSNVGRSEVLVVLNEFVGAISDQTAIGVGAEDYIRKAMIEALGEEKANGLMDRILLGSSGKGLEAIKWMDARAVAEMIKVEHPQIQAIVLSYLDSDHAGEVVNNLPANTRQDVIMRVASVEGIQPSALQELDAILEKQFSGSQNVQSSSVGGVKTAADILNFVDSTIEAEIMEKINGQDEDLGQNIADLMFVFDNLMDVDDRGIQTLLREIASDVLILALKGADAAMQEKIFKNMSSRAAEMMKDDLENKGPVKLSEVEDAQKEILTVARRLSDSGEIALGGGSEQFV